MKARKYIDLTLHNKGGDWWVEAKQGHGTQGRERFGPFTTAAIANAKFEELKGVRV